MNTALTTIPATGLSTAEELTKTIRATRILNIYENDVEEQGRILTLSKEISNADRQILTERHHALANSLRGCGLSIAARDRAALAITAMFRDGWPLYKMDNPKQVTAAYINALQDYPVWAVEAVCGALAKGMVEEVRPDYPPAAARVAQLCEAKTGDMREEKRKFVRLLSIKDLRAAPMTNEERAAALARHEKWKASQQPDQIDAEETAKLDESARVTIVANEKRILQEYAARGVPAHRASNGTLISPSLLKNLGLSPRPKAEMDR